MEQNEDALTRMLELAIFIPLIIASGGNAGGQSSTLVIRALAVGEMESRDWLRVLGREILIGLSIGIALGLIGFARAYFFGMHDDSMRLALVVGIGILCVVTLGTTIGSLLPIAIRRLGLDPAVSSAPFIASLIDVLGLIVYFGLARLMIATAF
jgi:magnesium transporter